MERTVARFRTLTDTFIGRFIAVAATAVLYYLAARFGLMLSFGRSNTSPLWPPSGIAFTAVLLIGARVWPGIMLGAFLANIVVFLERRAGSGAGVCLASFLLSAGYTLEALSGVFVFRRVAGVLSPFDRAGDYFKFVFAVLTACVTFGTTGTSVLALCGIIPWDVYGPVWLTSWVGRATGVIVITPLVLAWLSRGFGCSSRRLVEASALFLAVFLLCQCLFGVWPCHRAIYNRPNLILPLLVWVAFRFSLRETATCVAFVAVLAVWDTIRGYGPFLGGGLNDSLVQLQIYISIIAITSFSLCAALAERRRAAADLKALAATLEKRVRQRTADLTRATEILNAQFIEHRRLAEERARLIEELQRALAEVRQLSGLLPICAWCKKIRDDRGYWNQLEAYIAEHSDASFTHGICPECQKIHYPRIFGAR